jgi:hypothetical protein
VRAAETVLAVRLMVSAAARAAVPVRPGMVAAMSVSGLPVSSTTRVPGGMSTRNSSGSAGSVLMSSSSHQAASVSP